MPYNRRAKPLPKRPVKGTKKDYSQDKAIMTLKKKVSKLEHSEEVKYEDLYVTSTPASTGALYHCTGVAQGDNFNERVGEQITVKRAEVRFELNQIPSIVTSQVRLIMFWDKQCNGVGPTTFASTSLAEGLLDNTVITTTILSPYNVRTKNRYKILYDKCFKVEPVDATVNMKQEYKFALPLSSAIIQFIDSGFSAASISSRGLFMLLYSSSTSIASVRLGLRLFYTDA